MEEPATGGAPLGGEPLANEHPESLSVGGWLVVVTAYLLVPVILIGISDSGPYRLVRHPGYAESLLAVCCIAVALDSAWVFVASAVALFVSVLRTALEDRVLMEELPGCRENARRVRDRPFPGVWLAGGSRSTRLGRWRAPPSGGTSG